ETPACGSIEISTANLIEQLFDHRSDSHHLGRFRHGFSLCLLRCLIGDVTSTFDQLSTGLFGFGIGHRATPDRSGTYISAAVSEPCRPIRSNGPESASS